MKPSSILPVFSLLTIIFLIYSGSFNTPWVLDDPPNITQNTRLRIDNLMPETLWQTLHAKPFAPGSLYRPVANLSFALNWYIGQDNPFGYHVVNLVIHILASIFLLQTIILLFRTPALEKYSPQDAFFIAMLATVLWSINPIQTQAVTYIVQRMASLAAMFYIWAMYWYLRFRLTDVPAQRQLHLLLCGLCYLLSAGSKENGAILPLSLLALEFIFFSRPTEPVYQTTRKVFITVGIAIIPLGLWYCFRHHYFQNFFAPIGSRPYSLYERLLTEPGIVIFYLSLIFYPLPQRLSVDHGVTIAHSFFSPWSTLPAIVILFGLLLTAVLLRKKQPILSFAILFFFINHLIESTIIPLELIFEHRNYLPSMFLFMPVAAGLLYLLKIYSTQNRIIYGTILLFIPFLLIGTGWSTYLRNTVWASEKSLWLDAARKAPDNARAYAKLGELAGWNPERSPGQLALAIGYYQKALTGYSPRVSFKAAILGNMGEVFLMYGLYDQAIKNYTQSLALNPHFNNSQYGLAKALVMQGKFDDAFKQVALALQNDHFQSRFLNIGGLILLRQEKPEAALWSFQQAMKISAVKEKYFFNLGVALSRAGYYNRARWFLELSSKAAPDDIKILFSLLENSIRQENQQKTIDVAKKIIRRFSVDYIESNLKNMENDYRIVPVSTELIAPAIHRQLREHIRQLITKPEVYP